MDKDTQIKEMAFNLIMATSPLGVKDLTKVFDYKTVATDLYNLYGWRKEKQGEWKKVNEKYPRYVCTACNHLYNNKEYKYCPNCGARMKGE